jgi:hypothetical protein
MSEVLLTFHCAAGDAEVVGEAIRRVSPAPLHHRAEAVMGRDFSDAMTGEQVSGLLRRSAIELIAGEDMVQGIVAAVADARRRSPVRWQVVPVLDRGRIA